MRAVSDEGDRGILEALKSAVHGVLEPREQPRRLPHGARDWALANARLYRVVARVEPDYNDTDIPPGARELLGLFDARVVGAAQWSFVVRSVDNTTMRVSSFRGRKEATSPSG